MDDWRRRAACIDTPTAVFFPRKHAELDEGYRLARRICASCPVVEPCLAEANRQPVVEHGMWAGLTPHERRRLRPMPPEKERSREWQPSEI